MNELAEKSHTWTGPNAIDSTNRTHSTTSSGGMHQLRENDRLRAQVKLLTRELEAFKSKDQRAVYALTQGKSKTPCFICSRVDHLAQDCHTLGEMKGMYEQHCHALYKNPYTPYSNTYNPPPQYHTSPPPRNSLEDTLHAFIEAQSKTNQRFDDLLTQMVEEHKELKGQL